MTEHSIYNWHLGERIKCTAEEKEECLKTVHTIMYLVEKARKQGILILEEEIENAEPSFLKKGLKLIVDGNDPDLVRHILKIDMFSNASTGKDNLNRLIIYEGLLALQRGDHPGIVQEILFSFFPGDYPKDRSGLVSEKYHSYMRKLSTDNSKFDLNEFEKILLSLDDRGIQLLLRDCSMEDLAAGLIHMADPAKNRILENMTKSSVSMLLDDMEYMGEVPEKESRAGQEKLQGIIKKLEETGEIRIIS